MASAVEWASAGHPGWDQHPDPGGVPRVPVVDIVCSLQFYLDELGCVVREVADGWALLCSEPFALLLIHDPTHTSPGLTPGLARPWTDAVRTHRRPAGAAALIPPPLIRLSTPDVRALRHRLGSRALVPGAAHDSADKIDMYDPDRHRVVITQVGSCSRPQQMSTPAKEAPGHRLPVPDDFFSRDAAQRYLRDARLGGSQT
jgi:hypothetical protein